MEDGDSDRARSDARLAMTGATLAAVDVFLAYISVVIFFLSVSLLLFCYWRYSGRVRRALMPRDERTDGRTDGRRTIPISFQIGSNAISSSEGLSNLECQIEKLPSSLIPQGHAPKISNLNFKLNVNFELIICWTGERARHLAHLLSPTAQFARDSGLH